MKYLFVIYIKFQTPLTVTPAERKEREASNAPVYIVKLRDSDIILESTASLMLHVHGNPNPAVEL